MKKLLILIIAFTIIPLTSFAYTGTWGFLSTSTPNYYPLSVNGIMPGVWADHFVASSTLATSTFLTKVMIGNALNGGMLAPVGFTGIPYVTPSLQTSFNPDAVTGGAGQLAGGYTLANTGVGAYDAVPIVFNNASSTFVGTNSVDYAAIAFSGPYFSAYPGLPANSLGLQVSDGAMIFDVSTSTASKAFMAWGIGPGYTAGNYDMVLKNLTGSIVGTGQDSGLGIGSTSPDSHLSIELLSSSTYPFMDMDKFNSITGVRTPIFYIGNNGNVGIGTASPTSTLEVNGNITLSAGANRIINVGNATTSVNGYNLSLLSANGGASVGNTVDAGGALNLLAGGGGPGTGYTSYGYGGIGGDINVITGVGGSLVGDGVGFAYGGASGALNLSTGIGGTGTTNPGISGVVTLTTGNGLSSVGYNTTGGQTGSTNLKTGNAGAADGGNIGGSAGSITITSGYGGSSQTASTTGTNTGGISGNVQMTIFYGGSASGGKVNVGGNAGSVTFNGGYGGNAGGTSVVSTSTGGNASGGAFVAGNGGTAQTTTANNRTTIGGNGGSWNYTAGDGGVATNGSVATGGLAGSITFLAGKGGSASGGASNIAQNGGSLNFLGGLAGTGGNTNGGNLYFLGGAKNASGLDGNILLGINAAGTARGFVGIGTTSPASTLTVKGHIGTDGAIPTLSSCGTAPSIVVGSTDTAFEITEGTIATGCTITFQTAYARTPFVTLSAQSGLTFSYTTSSTTITITNIGALSGTIIDAHVISNDL